MLALKLNDWKHVHFDYPDNIPTMISAEEKRYLYWLGSFAWKGLGKVVEIGPWLGGSTTCLAAGMRVSDQNSTKLLHGFDNFLWSEFMADRVALPIDPGKSSEPFFLKNIKSYKDIVELHRRALPDEVIDSNIEAVNQRFSDDEKIPILDDFTDGPVEILFIDGAKS